ncbi:MAG: hypothetical protein WDW38_005552 [Sanguina aurantia]
MVVGDELEKEERQPHGNKLPSLDDTLGTETASRLRATMHSLANKSVVPATKELKFVSPRNELPPMGGINKPGPALRGNRDGADDVNSPLRSGKSQASTSETLPYVKLIHTLREYPNTEDFVYLRRMERVPSEYDPYALALAPFASVDQADFYTMSVRGVTHYLDGASSDMASLDQWERELRLFAALKQLRLFRQYKLWKSFRTWRRAVNAHKFSAARAALGKHLFLLSPVFQAPMCAFHALCSQLSHKRLHALEDGKRENPPTETLCVTASVASQSGLNLLVAAGCTLDEFVEHQALHKSVCEKELALFHSAVFSNVLGACTADLAKLEERLQEFHSKHEEAEGTGPTANSGTRGLDAAGGGGGGPAGKPGRGGPFGGHTENAKAREQASSDFAYTIAAAKRSEQRRLLNFIRMSDYMICDTLHSVLLESLRDVLAATHPPEPSVVITDESSGEAAAAAGKAARRRRRQPSTQPARLTRPCSKGPRSDALFEIELLLADNQSDLIYDPAPSEYQGEVQAILSAYLASLCTLSRLCGDPLLMGTVLGERAGEAGGPGTELQDLVANESYDDLVAAIMDSMDDAFAAAEAHKEVYFPLRSMVLYNRELDVPGLADLFKAKDVLVAAVEVADGLFLFNGWEGEGAEPAEPSDAAEAAAPPPTPKVTLTTFRNLLDLLADQRTRMQALPAFSDVSIIRVNCSKLKTAMLPSPIRALAQMHQLLPALTSDLFQSPYTTELFPSRHAPLNFPPASAVEDYVEKIQFLVELRDCTKVMDRNCNEIHDLYALIDEYSIQVPPIERAAFATLDSTYNSLKLVMEEVEGAREEDVAKYRFSLDAGIESVAREVTELRNAAQHEMVLSESSEHERVLAHLGELRDACDRLARESARINKYQALFKVQESQSDELFNTAEEITLKLSLWQGMAEFEGLVEAWTDTQFDGLDTAHMEESLARFHKAVFKMERGLPPNKLVPRLRSAVDEYRGLLPVVVALRNRALKERHWGKVYEAIGQAIPRDASFTLKVLLEARVTVWREAIATISTEATQEAGLEEMLGAVQAKWADIEFVVLAYKEMKDVFILGQIEDVQVALEDSMVTMATILSSRFVGGIRPEVEKVERQLTLFAETLDEWVQVQKAWMYLEPIFSAPDIQRQLPVEAKAFAATDKQLRDIMRRTKDRPNALLAGTQPGVLEAFQRAGEALEVVQKNLEDYLETKRMAFPRFYFLSNDELLEILAQAKNVQAVQPHMGKCFDGIRRLDFGDDPKGIDISAMISGEGERVSLGKNLKARGNVERWLSEVESSMIASLRKLSKRGFTSYADEPRPVWVLHQPAQLVIAVSQIYWCAAVEERLRGGTQRRDCRTSCM